MAENEGRDKAVDIDDIGAAEVKAYVGDRLIVDILEERKAERRWTAIRRMLYTGLLAATVAAYLGFMAGWWGYRAIPMSDSVAVVPINGVIAKDSVASANAVITVLDKLFDSEKVQGIVLNIDSGGGSPTEAERISNYIARKKEETGKPVIAVCGTMCASAAYMIAIHADEVVIGEYTWAGSIGAILKGWDFEAIARRLEVDQRVFASGPMKDLMNPFKELPEPMAEKMSGLVNQTGIIFAETVKSQRGDRLVASEDLFSGEVWVGKDCVRLGLVDRVGTLEDVIVDRFGGLPHAVYTPKRVENSFFSSVLSEIGAGIAERVMQRLEPRVEM